MPKEIRIGVDTVRDWAVGTLQEWWQGYTDVLGDGQQRKLTTEQVTEGGLIAGVQAMGAHGGRGPTKYYEITLDVKETDDPRTST